MCHFCLRTTDICIISPGGRRGVSFLFIRSFFILWMTGMAFSWSVTKIMLASSYVLFFLLPGGGVHLGGLCCFSFPSGDTSLDHAWN